MKILFITFGELSASGRNIRPVSILRALADAGHQVQVLAASTDLLEHPNILNIAAVAEHKTPRWKIRIAALKATGSMSFDAVHAVDDAVVFASKVCRLRKIRLIYDARRCFTGPAAVEPFAAWKWFPKRYQKREIKILLQAERVFIPCSNLGADLKSLCPGVSIEQIEDIPLQSCLSLRTVDRPKLLEKWAEASSPALVCCVLPDQRPELKKVLMAARKVIDSMPGSVFFFKGSLSAEAEALATHLDIHSRSVFLPGNEAEIFLSALEAADAALLVPDSGCRYIHPEVFTLLYAPAPLVVVQEGACDHVLTEQNCIQVLSSSETIAEGLLRAIQEPLFSRSLASEGQRMIAERYSLSSFKHKIRMSYREVAIRE